MSTSFTVKGRQNVSVSLKDQANKTISSSIGGVDATLEVVTPQVFDTPTVGDAVELSDLLEGIDIRYVASTAGYSHGASVGSWANSGGLSGYDLSNSSTDTSIHPTFNIGGTNNPFSTGAMRFVLDSDGNTSQHLYWGTLSDGSGGSINTSSLSTDGAFSMYMVVSKDNIVGGNQKRMSSPLWVRGTSGQALFQSRPALKMVPSSQVSFVELNGSAFSGFGEEHIHRASGTSDITLNDGDKIILITTVDSSGNLSCFDFNAKNFVNESKSIGSFDPSQTKGAFIANSFGGPPQKPLGLLPDGVEDGDAIYIAEFGLFSKKLEGQKAASLGRLLKEKYQIS